MGAHTPGPWVAVPGQSPIVIREARFIVCTIPGPWGNEWCEANARLIAAAPDLLEACEAALTWVAVATPREDAHPAAVNHANDLACLRAAIAKARGAA